MFKSAFIIMAPDGDPAKHRMTLQTEKAQLTAVFIEIFDFDKALEVAEELVQKDGVQSIYLCPGFTNQAVGRISAAVSGKAAVQVGRGDSPSTIMVGEMLGKEGWFDE
ncbi:MAG: DUF6506 family protein [Dehalococcoidia bacterium]|jgi:hypothetical protein